MRRIPLMGFWALMLAGPAFAQAPQRPNMVQIVQRADTNGDGRVTFEELSAFRPEIQREQFDQLDTNGDGVLTMADRPGPGGAGGVPPFAVAAAERLLALDRDGDGKVSYTEVSAAKPGYPRENFSRLDVNGDGSISNEDVETIRRAAQGQPAPARRDPPGEEAPLRRILQADTNGDGRITFDEAKAGYPQLTRQQFNRLDRNGDGVISREDRRDR